MSAPVPHNLVSESWAASSCTQTRKWEDWTRTGHAYLAGDRSDPSRQCRRMRRPVGDPVHEIVAEAEAWGAEAVSHDDLPAHIALPGTGLRRVAGQRQCPERSASQSSSTKSPEGATPPSDWTRYGFTPHRPLLFATSSATNRSRSAGAAPRPPRWRAEWTRTSRRREHRRSRRAPDPRESIRSSHGHSGRPPAWVSTGRPGPGGLGVHGVARTVVEGRAPEGASLGTEQEDDARRDGLGHGSEAFEIPDRQSGRR